jgi:hypothetical protein
MRHALASWLRRVADRLDGRWEGLPRNLQPRAALQSFQLRAWSCAITLRIARIADSKETSFNTASGVLIEFPRRAVIATAWHVLQEFRRSRDSGEQVVLVCDHMPIATPRTAYRDERNDLAFIEVPTIGRGGIHAVPYRPGPMWPPPRVQVDDSVLVSGFPKRLRYDGDEILHGDFNVLVDVASAAASHFMLNIDWKALGHAGRVRLRSEQVDYGGVSGGPVFLWDGGPNPLVGVVSEAGRDLPLWRIAAFSDISADIECSKCEPL